MFREMFLVTGLSKYRENDASATDADTVLKMATLGGAAARGFLTVIFSQKGSRRT